MKKNYFKLLKELTYYYIIRLNYIDNTKQGRPAILNTIRAYYSKDSRGASIVCLNTYDYKAPAGYTLGGVFIENIGRPLIYGGPNDMLKHIEKALDDLRGLRVNYHIENSAYTLDKLDSALNDLKSAINTLENRADLDAAQLRLIDYLNKLGGAFTI